MLTLTGKCLGVTSETINGPTGPFLSTTIHTLNGFDSVRLRVGRDFPPADLPKEGDDFAVEVSASAFSRRDGSAGVQLTALKLAASAVRPHAVNKAS